ncbi:Tyrosine recombinase XerD [Candidatus Magnetomoraceae bacterium gMMP-15]
MIKFEPDREVNIFDAVDEYLNYNRSIAALSETSLYNRSLELKRFYKFCIDRKIQKATELNKNMIISYLGSLNVASGTKKTIMSILSAFLDYLVNENLIIDNYLATVKKPKVYQIEGDYLKRDEIDHLFYTVTTTTKTKQLDRNLLLLSMFTVLCMRVGETVNLKLNEVHLNEKTIWITRKGGKIAKLPLNEDLIEKFLNWYEMRKDYKGSKNPWVFLTINGRQMQARQARYIVSQALDKSGIIKRKKGPHLLRHSGATLYLQQGVDIKTIQMLLGHSDLTTTSKYVHSDSATLTNSINNCPKFGTNNEN